MSQSILEIERICGKIKNKKGVKAYVEIVEECGVTEIPAPMDVDPADKTTYHRIDGNIKLKADYTAVKWYGRKKGAFFKFADEGDQDEEIVKVEGELYIPHIDGFKTWNTNQTRGTEYIIRFWDENTTTPRVIGEIANGITIRVEEQYDPKNGYILRFSGELSEKPYWHSGNFENA